MFGFGEKKMTNLEVGKAYRVPSEIPAWKIDEAFYATMGPSRFLVKDILVLEVKTSKYLTVRFRSENFEDSSIYLPLDFKGELLPDSRAEEIQKEYENKVNRGLEKYLSGSVNSGSDPEIFVEDEKGALIPAFNFLPGKDNPLVVAQYSGYSKQKAYWDGFQAEFTTVANSCLSVHIDSIQAGLKAVLNAARIHNSKAKLSIRTVFDIPQEMLTQGKQEHVEFGCMPSLNAYGMRGLSVPGRQALFRPAGGHIHLGVSNKQTSEKFASIVKVMDAIVGVACVSLAASFDDPRRREMYGLAGEHRLPPHGLEYRVLSNFWLFHPLITNLVFDLTRKAYFMGEKNFGRLWKTDEAEVIETINKCDVVQARKILERNKDVMFKILESTYVQPYSRARLVGPSNLTKEDISRIFAIYVDGLESVIENPTDIAGNWRLDGKWATHANNDSLDVAASIPLIQEGKKIA